MMNLEGKNGGLFDTHAYEHGEPQKEPTYRPYNDEEMKGLVGEVFKSKKYADIGILTCVSGSLAYLHNDTVSNLRLLEYYAHKDGSPCGVLED